MRISCRVFLCVAGLLAARASFADEGDDDRRRPEKQLSEADEMRFRALVKDGARAADDGRLNDVIRAYMAALDIRRDPLISGRLGLVLAMTNDPSAQVIAAGSLYKAISEHAGVSRAERKAFFDAFDLVQSKICRIYVTTNDVNAVVQMDDNKRIKSHGSYWEFAEPGKHEIVGTLDDHDDVRSSIVCPAGKRIEVFLDFAHKDAPIKMVESVRDKLVFVEPPSPMSSGDKLSKPDPNTNRRVNFALGPAMVFGVAPSPAYGISLSGAYNLGNVMVNVTTRGTYALGPFTDVPLDVFSFNALVGPCKSWNWLNGCAFASVNLIKSRPTAAVPDDFYTTAQLVPGLGIGIGARQLLGRNVRVYAGGDAMILSHETMVIVPRANGSLHMWSGGHFLASLSLGLEFAP